MSKFDFLDCGGERGIRTPDGVFDLHTPLAGERLQPLGHLSVRLGQFIDLTVLCQVLNGDILKYKLNQIKSYRDKNAIDLKISSRVSAISSNG